MPLPLFLWESLVLGAFGAVVSTVVGAMAAGALKFANIELPLSVQLLLMSDAGELSDLAGALAGAIALIGFVTGVRAFVARGFRLRSRGRDSISVAR